MVDVGIWNLPQGRRDSLLYTVAANVRRLNAIQLYGTTRSLDCSLGAGSPGDDCVTPRAENIRLRVCKIYGTVSRVDASSLSCQGDA